MRNLDCPWKLRNVDGTMNIVAFAGMIEWAADLEVSHNGTFVQLVLLKKKSEYWKD